MYGDKSGNRLTRTQTFGVLSLMGVPLGFQCKGLYSPSELVMIGNAGGTAIIQSRSLAEIHGKCIG